jgi:hypothetical protein
MSSPSPPPDDEEAIAARDPQPALQEPPAAPARCKNCDALLSGKYCANCSQSADVHLPTTPELLHELLEGITHSDSRLWRTLKYLWFKPGKLTQEFVAGRRVAYLPPFRLYLVLSIAFFLIASISPPSGESHRVNQPAGFRTPSNESCDEIRLDLSPPHPEWTERMQHVCREIVRDNASTLMHIVLATMSKAMFIFLPLIAFLHMLMYWRPRYPYAEHLLFFVHLHALFFSAGLLMLVASDTAQAWPKLQWGSDLLQTLLGWSVSIYTVIAVRRVFAKSWRGAIFKSLALSVVYLGVFALTIGVVFVYAILQL